MAIKKLIKKLQKQYVLNHANKATLPSFEPSALHRQHFIFRGKVQGVGFRVEIYGIARRIGLTGWVQNNPDDSVEAELQGEIERIEFLVSYMKNLDRAEVDSLDVVELEVNSKESEFQLRM